MPVSTKSKKGNTFTYRSPVNQTVLIAARLAVAEAKKRNATIVLSRRGETYKVGPSANVQTLSQKISKRESKMDAKR